MLSFTFLQERLQKLYEQQQATALKRSAAKRQSQQQQQTQQIPAEQAQQQQADSVKSSGYSRPLSSSSRTRDSYGENGHTSNAGDAFSRTQPQVCTSITAIL